jgi:hypothetical protein
LAASSTRFLVSLEISPRSLSTRETVVIDRFVSLAISLKFAAEGLGCIIQILSYYFQNIKCGDLAFFSTPPTRQKLWHKAPSGAQNTLRALPQ